MNWIRFSTCVKREIQRFVRIPIQTLISPWISALLYLLVFGFFLGERIQFLDGISYIDFVFPGILTMHLIQASFGQSSSSLYFQRFIRSIDELLTSPLSYTEMILGYIAGSVTRALAVGAGVFVLALLFTQATIAHLGLFVFWVILTAVLFSLLGLIIGLWSEKFEHLSVLQTFVITPLLYIGGVFTSLTMLPESLQFASTLNPFFYLVDGIRFSLIGYSESNMMLGAIGLVVLNLILFILVNTLFRRGWKIRS